MSDDAWVSAATYHDDCARLTAENDALRALLRDIEAAAKPPGTEVGWSTPPWSDLYDRIWAEVHGPKPERTADQPIEGLDGWLDENGDPM